MGLHVSHDCWDGSYSGFMLWREVLTKAAGFPPLRYMEGFVSEDIIDEPLIAPYTLDDLPIAWNSVPYTPLILLLHHSDCDGILKWKDCNAIADELEKCIPFFSKKEANVWEETTMQFAAGLRKAAKQKKNVVFS